jgi:hypothetical protein
MKGEQSVSNEEEALRPITNEILAKKTGVPIGVPKIGAATPDLQKTTSYGLFGINNLRSIGKDGKPVVGSSTLDGFVKMFPNFGLPDPGSQAEPEKTKLFNEAWWNLARNKPQEMLQAQLKWFGKTFEDPTKKSLSEKLPANIANNVGVQLFMTDRRIQYGWKIAQNGLEIGKNAKTPEEFIRIVSQYDEQNLRSKYFTKPTDEQYKNIEQGLKNRIKHRVQMSLELLNETDSGQQIYDDSANINEMRRLMRLGNGPQQVILQQNFHNTTNRQHFVPPAQKQQLNPTMQ